MPKQIGKQPSLKLKSEIAGMIGRISHRSEGKNDENPWSSEGSSSPKSPKAHTRRPSDFGDGGLRRSFTAGATAASEVSGIL